MRMLLWMLLATSAAAQEPSKDTYFEFHNFPKGGRIFFNNKEFPIAKIMPQRLQVRSDYVKDTVNIRVEIPTSNGNYRSWQVTKKYRAGDTVVVTVPDQADYAGRLRVIVPLDTIVYINGKITLQEGEVRDFSTPPLAAPYQIKVKFDFRNKTGRRVIRTETVHLLPGETTVISDIENLTESVEK